jgi:hypothetical protein
MRKRFMTFTFSLCRPFALRRILAELSTLNERVSALTLAQESTKMAILDSFNTLSAEVDTIVTEIAALKAQIQAGNPITAEQLDALTAKLKAAE